MLVLTRRPGESVRIGDDIEVTVVEVRGEQVRLAVRAPRHVPVERARSGDDPDGPRPPLVDAHE